MDTHIGYLYMSYTYSYTSHFYSIQKYKIRAEVFTIRNLRILNSFTTKIYFIHLFFIIKYFGCYYILWAATSQECDPILKYIRLDNLQNSVTKLL